MKPVPLVPPLKCQGIKTKLVPEIQLIAEGCRYDRWIEPFCGSCVVALNVQPRRALLADTNVHVIRLYQDIQSGMLTVGSVRSFLKEEGEKLSRFGEPFYYEVRTRFNNAPNSLDFLFLNRSCFNGVIRFNRRGYFNTPYGHKPLRFAQGYITKIANQVAQIAKVIAGAEDWKFEVADFGSTLAKVSSLDFVYADPPYAGRTVDYFSTWLPEDEARLAATLGDLRCKFLLSTWHSNEFRRNESIDRVWGRLPFHLTTKEHYYHVGASEALRHPMIEALISNFSVKTEGRAVGLTEQGILTF